VTKLKVRCPRCGHEFYVDVHSPRQKGEGARYAPEIKRLTPLHVAILSVLAERGPMTKKRLGAILAEEGRRVSGNSLSGRLSELLGLGLVECKYTEVKEVDPDSKQFRFVKKPVWSITESGRVTLAGLAFREM
jgi:hypothetical protein